MSIDFSDLIKLASNFGELSATVLDQQISLASFLSGTELQKEARTNVAIDTGALKLSIQNSVGKVSNGYLVKVSPAQPYGVNIEFGQPAGTYVSPAALAGWASRKGLNPYAVSRSIMKKGTRAQPFLFPALDNKTDTVVSIYTQAIVNALQTLNK
jgi:hypothetical protein